MHTDLTDISARYIKGVGPDRLQLLKRIGINTVKDALMYFPRRYEDRSNIKPVSELQGTKVDQIVIGSCTNGRLDDLEIAATILKGKKVCEQTRMLVFPASWRIYKDALKAGYISVLIDAGAVVCNPGCGPCLGVHQGALGDGEKALSTTNRNFKGRMGNPDAEVYLCSAAVAAASAITGVITDPTKQ